MNSLNYDKTSPQSIETYAKTLEGKTIKEVSGEYEINGGKGKLGQLVETEFFGYSLNSDSEADFYEAGVELKVCPVKRIVKRPSSDMMMKRHGLSAKERIIISIINYENIVDEIWENASFRKKLHLLLMFYLHDSGVEVDQQTFELISLWEPNDEDLRIIKSDWQKIHQKVVEGRAHELSEGDTMYLGACTKGATKESVRIQPNSSIMAMQRAFSLKRNYVDFIYEELFLKKLNRQEIGSTKGFMDFFTELRSSLNQLKGKSVEYIMNMNSLTRERKAKNFLNLFSKDLIGSMYEKPYVKIKELEKSGLELKCILLGPNSVPKESMSFEQIDYCNIISEEWESSTIRDKFENKKHLWLVFRTEKSYARQSDVDLNDIYFEKAMYWNMPISDLDNHYYELWEDTVGKIKSGDYNNFMKTTDNKVGHIRPKGKDSSDLMVSPQGTYERKMCFWLNANYVAKQIENND